MSKPLDVPRALAKLRAQRAEAMEEQAYLNGSPWVIGAQRALVRLCKKIARLDNRIADLESQMENAA